MIDTVRIDIQSIVGLVGGRHCESVDGCIPDGDWWFPKQWAIQIYHKELLHSGADVEATFVIPHPGTCIGHWIHKLDGHGHIHVEQTRWLWVYWQCHVRGCRICLDQKVWIGPCAFVYEVLEHDLLQCGCALLKMSWSYVFDYSLTEVLRECHSHNSGYLRKHAHSLSAGLSCFGTVEQTPSGVAGCVEVCGNA